MADEALTHMAPKRTARCAPRRASALAALALAALLVAGVARASAVPSHWVGAWGAAPAVTGSAVVDRTLRLVVNPHRGGQRLRVRLSNRFGSRPFTIARVSVARRGAGAALIGSVRAVRFGGRRGVTIPRGAEVVSDPVALRFAAFRDLAVSVYVHGSSGPSTVHAVASEVGAYTAAGDATARPSAKGFGSPGAGWPFLTGVEVSAPRQVHTVVAFGDSITDGYQSTVERLAGERNTRWPDFFARRLTRARRPFSVVNEAISGNRLRLDALSPAFGPSALSRLDSDVLAVPGVTDVIVLEGINDIGQPPPASAAAVIAALRQIVARLHDAGLRALVGTLTPSGRFAAPTYGNAAADGRRRAVNTWIRHSHVPDAVIDFDAAMRDPAHPSRLRPAYDSGDHLHPNARGYEHMAAAIPLRLFPR